LKECLIGTFSYSWGTELFASDTSDVTGNPSCVLLSCDNDVEITWSDQGGGFCDNGTGNYKCDFEAWNDCYGCLPSCGSVCVYEGIPSPFPEWRLICYQHETDAGVNPSLGAVGDVLCKDSPVSQTTEISMHCDDCQTQDPSDVVEGTITISSSQCKVP